MTHASRGRMAAALLAVLLSAWLAAGCATTNAADGAPRSAHAQKVDPWESWNRKVFGFNEALDAAVLKPVATAYVNIVPQPIRRGIDNFLGNIGDAWSAINNFLQGKGAAGLQDVMRVGTNTFFGLGGLVDFATEFGLSRQGEDFGQTLGAWGFATGPYVVWPVFGPSTLRESFALPLDRGVSAALLFGDTESQVGVTLLNIVNARANLLGASRVLDDVALDKYVFVRDAYLQRRRSLVYDGDPPPLPDDDEEPPEPAAPAASAPQ